MSSDQTSKAKPATPRPAGRCVEYEQNGGIATITLNRPLAKNALSMELVHRLDEAIDMAEASQGCKCIILRAVGDVFCAGADLKMVLSHLEEFGTLDQFMTAIRGVQRKIETSRLPVIAAVQGLAIAGGLELALTCDLIVASESALFADGHVNYGMFPGGGGAVRLQRVVGPMRAKQLLLAGETWTASEAAQAGLVAVISQPGDLEAVSTRVATQIASFSAPAVAGMKRIVNQSTSLSVEEGLDLERAEFHAYASGPDIIEGLKAFQARSSPTGDQRKTNYTAQNSG